MIFAGVAASSVVFLLKQEFATDLFGEADVSVAVLLFVIAFLGVPVVGGLARLRKAQLRYYGIINNIRKYFLEEDYKLWNAAQLSEQTLPKVRRDSGTYMWVVMVFFTSCSLFALASYILTIRLWVLCCSGTTDGAHGLASLVALVSFIVSVGLEDALYFKWAKPRQPIVYSSFNDPLNPKPNQPAVSTS